MGSHSNLMKIAASEKSDARTMQHIVMTVDDWIKIPDCPIQRDTERHAKKALTAHLSSSSPTQSRVACAEFPGGMRIKLDGHTRAYLWQKNLLARPFRVNVDVYPVKLMSEVLDLYKHFDNAQAAENAPDRLSGAYRLHGIAPKSRLLQSGGITSALKIIEGERLPIYDSVQRWKSELLWLDELPGASPESLPSPLIVAALLTYRKRGRRVTPFWQAYIDDTGNRIDGKSDGVDALKRLVDDLRGRRALTTGRFNIESSASKAISCVEAWIAGRTYSGGIKPTDLRSYIVAAERATL